MDTQEWLHNQIEQLIVHAQSYSEQAFYRGLQQLVNEQNLRLEHLQGELDGRMWSPEQW